MIPGIYNFPDSIAGNTIRARQIKATRTVDSVTTDIDLTNHNIIFELTISSSTEIRKEVGDGITITDAQEGEFRIDKFILNRRGTWNYKISFLNNDTGDYFTYLQGQIKAL